MAKSISWGGLSAAAIVLAVLGMTACARADLMLARAADGPAGELRVRAEQEMERGDEALEAGDYNRALRHYTNAAGFHPKRGAVPEMAPRWLRLGDALAAQGTDAHDESALGCYRMAVTADPRLPGPRLGMARIYLKRHRKIDHALKLLEEEEALRPGRPEVAVVRTSLQEFRARALAEHAERERQRREAREARAQAAADAQRRRAALTEKLTAQVHEAHGIACRTVAFEELGKTVGPRLSSSTASGTYVGVLIKCVNLGDQTLMFPLSEFGLVDGDGKQYAVDSRGSFKFALSKQDDQIRNPEALQLHPDVGTLVGLVFDVPESALTDPGLRLFFAGHTYRLVFETGDTQ